MPPTPGQQNSSNPGQQTQQSQPQTASTESILIAVLCVLIFVFLLCLVLITRWKRNGNNKTKMTLYDLLGIGRVIDNSSSSSVDSDTSSLPKSNRNAKKPKTAAKINTFYR